MIQESMYFNSKKKTFFQQRMEGTDADVIKLHEKFRSENSDNKKRTKQ